MIIADRVLFYDGVIVVEVSHQGGIKLQPVIGHALRSRVRSVRVEASQRMGLEMPNATMGRLISTAMWVARLVRAKGKSPHNHDVAHPDELKKKIELRMVLCRTGTVINNDLAQSGGIGARIWGANALDVLLAEELFFVWGGHSEFAHGQVHRGGCSFA